jgi:hypothetical protein
MNWAAVLVTAALFSCTDALVEPTRLLPSQADDRLALMGRVCTAPPDPGGFPVKVVIVVDQSGSMCVSDPPGSQGGSGFCERAAVQAIVPPGVTEPARVRALRRLVNQFRQQPNVQVSIVPFETNVSNVWPPSSSNRRFARPDSSIDTYMSGLQSQLGKGTDYQGALSYAYTVVASDIQQVSLNNPEQLPRTRYVVVFLTDGTPYPRCAANDDLTTYADPDNPDLTWADSSSAVDFCNLLDDQQRQTIFGTDNIPGYAPGTDRNQNYQLFSYVDQLMELREQFNVGDIRLHTVLLFNEEAVRACGLICQDLYGTYPNVAPADYPQAAKKIASWLLQRFAERGNGIYQEFTDGNVFNMSLGALDYSSLASPNVMKTLLLQPLSSVPGPDRRLVDSDGDGLPDELDNTFTHGTNRFIADTDDDCFDDHFEVRRLADGFSPTARDGRGCDPASPLTLGCSCRDTDGDGLSQFAEAYLKTRTGLMDSDGDGIPDGVEARFGLDPARRNEPGLDTDGDGIPDLLEIRAGSDPTRRDRAFYERYGFQYEVRAEVQPDESVCYEFAITNVHLVTPPSRAGQQQGFNLFKLYFAEAPASGVVSDYGVWKTACAWAQYDPPQVRVPAGPELTFEDANFQSPNQMVSAADYASACVGVAP